jgi:hypothetical protein
MNPDDSLLDVVTENLLDRLEVSVYFPFIRDFPGKCVAFVYFFHLFVHYCNPVLKAKRILWPNEVDSFDKTVGKVITIHIHLQSLRFLQKTMAYKVKCLE